MSKKTISTLFFGIAVGIGSALIMLRFNLLGKNVLFFDYLSVAIIFNLLLYFLIKFIKKDFHWSFLLGSLVGILLFLFFGILWLVALGNQY